MNGKVAVLLVAALLVVTLGLIFAVALGSQEARDKVAVSVVPIDPARLPEPLSQAAELWRTRCMGCHELPDPASHEPLHWRPVLRRMNSHATARSMPRLDAHESQVVVEWLDRHAPGP